MGSMGSRCNMQKKKINKIERPPHRYTWEADTRGGDSAQETALKAIASVPIHTYYRLLKK